VFQEKKRNDQQGNEKGRERKKRQHNQRYYFVTLGNKKYEGNTFGTHSESKLFVTAIMHPTLL
jgi:hypothetical protein